MSFRKVSTVAAAAAATIALSTVAYASNGQSPNGQPGPAGNPNQPAAQPQANGPQGPQGNNRGKSAAAHSKSHGKSASAHARSHGKSNASHGESTQSHGKSLATHGKSGENHPSTTRSNKSGGQDNNFGHGKITICHGTSSADSRHHEGSWKDIIPAPNGADAPAKDAGCPATVEQSSGQTPQSTPTTAQTASPQSLVLGERVSGKAKPAAKAKGKGPQSMVLGANASGRTPAAARAARPASARGLPFTGTQLAFVLICAAVALMGGIALRRALSGQS